ncbi:pyruvate ferredoxin oxidoreductase [Candidatus Bathyarchaeota archaeon]|nr:pyruvate ferredoxin oxidoreductase [Candidatus Bathyarchaeota archaeon]
MVEIAFHGRGGQGGITASNLLVKAAYNTGKYPFVMAFPVFGPERRGAPVGAYARISTHQLFDRTKIDEPDIMVIMDHSILKSVNPITSLKEGGTLLVNAPGTVNDFRKEYGVHPSIKLGIVDILQIDIDIGLMIGGNIPILNTPILGAFCKLFEDIPLDVMLDVIKEKFSGNGKATLNAKGATIAFESLQVS